MDAVEFTGDLAPFASQCVTMSQITLQGPADLGSGIRNAGRDPSARRSGDDRLHLGHNRHIQGAMLTHGNIASNISVLAAGLQHAAGTDQHLVSAALPHHRASRGFRHALPRRDPRLLPVHDRLPAQLCWRCSPTIFVAVPRVYEKIYAQAELKAKGFPKRSDLQLGALGRTAPQAGDSCRARRPRRAAGSWPTKLVFSKIRAGHGREGRRLSFPVARRWDANWPSGMPTVGIRIHEGYGLTETSPVIAVNTPSNHRIGTVGKTLPNLEVRIAEDGEILVRGPSVFKGYWNRPEETQSGLVDGWFKTGDIGNIDADGYLSVTDRKKDLIKTSGGKFIAPQPIENSLKLNPLIGVAAILGDKRKFPAVLISPNFALLEDWARENEIAFSSRAELVANPKVQALYEGIVEEINQNLARFEKLKRVLLVADEFTPDNGVLTPTLKLRRVIEERYRRNRLMNCTRRRKRRRCPSNVAPSSRPGGAAALHLFERWIRSPRPARLFREAGSSMALSLQ